MGKTRKAKKIKSFKYMRKGKPVNVRSHTRHYNVMETVPYKRISKAQSEKIMRSRSKRAINTDLRKTSRKVYENPNSVWASNPGRSDVKGLDDSQAIVKEKNKKPERDFKKEQEQKDKRNNLVIGALEKNRTEGNNIDASKIRSMSEKQLKDFMKTDFNYRKQLKNIQKELLAFENNKESPDLAKINWINARAKGILELTEKQESGILTPDEKERLQLWEKSLKRDLENKKRVKAQRDANEPKGNKYQKNFDSMIKKYPNIEFEKDENMDILMTGSRVFAIADNKHDKMAENNTYFAETIDPSKIEDYITTDGKPIKIIGDHIHESKNIDEFLKVNPNAKVEYTIGESGGLVRLKGKSETAYQAPTMNEEDIKYIPKSEVDKIANSGSKRALIRRYKKLHPDDFYDEKYLMRSSNTQLAIRLIPESKIKVMKNKFEDDEDW